ncbi:hypothetical protein TNCV_4482721 [Trichonephila clavipes]|nr:hypothetical protein TNCV_4482721 [Trichonephila clavipes]
METQMCLIRLRSAELSGQGFNCNSFLCSSRTLLTQFKPFDLGRCPAGRSHFQMGKQTSYKGTTDPQLCSDSLLLLQSLLPDLQVSRNPRVGRLICSPISDRSAETHEWDVCYVVPYLTGQQKPTSGTSDM